MFVCRGAHPVSHSSNFGRAVTCSSTMIMPNNICNKKYTMTYMQHHAGSTSFASVRVERLSTCAWVVTTAPPGNRRRCASVVVEHTASPAPSILRRWNLARTLFSFRKCLLHTLQVQVQLRLLFTDSNL